MTEKTSKKDTEVVSQTTQSTTGTDDQLNETSTVVYNYGDPIISTPVYSSGEPWAPPVVAMYMVSTPRQDPSIYPDSSNWVTLSSEVEDFPPSAVRLLIDTAEDILDDENIDFDVAKELILKIFDRIRKFIGE